MIEVTQTYDLLPAVDRDTYADWVKKAIGLVLKQPGLVEFRAHRNLLGSPQVRTTTVWQSGADWAHFAEGAWQTLEPELRRMATNLRIELWGPSPMVTEPLRPGR
ncbi:antibiotic biosynthesis monooxygenase [Mizugakiibacter sediminis]|nr:antibiotic biosynthesis monooxygenase [Mizugakiibacter sediminis]